MVDPVTLEIIHNALRSMCYEMEAAIDRTAMSIIVREQHDCGVGILDGRGHIVIGSPFSFSSETLHRFARESEMHEGDVVVFNDPYLSQGEISHLGDMMVASPVFWEGDIAGFTTAWGHQMDVGAAAPAGMPTQATDLFQEGLQIPPVKLYEQGRLNKALLDILARNSRTPEMMVGDTLALVAAGKIGERRLHELFEKFGTDTVLETFEILFDQAKQTAAKLIALLPDEPLVFEDWLDDDGIVDEPLKIRLSLYKADGKLHVDFSGTSPQCKGPLNMPLHPTMMKLWVYNTLCLCGWDKVQIDPMLNPNHGMSEMFEIHVPEGCFLNPTYPAPVGLRHLSGGRLFDMLLGLMSKVFPDAVPAATNGSLNCYTLLGSGTGKQDRWMCFEVTGAGSGARPYADGIDAFCFNTRLKNAPVEFVETVYPVRIEKYALRPDSAGPGKFRGGTGLVRLIRSLRDARLYFLDERQRYRPWGLYGGQAAVSGDAYIQRADGELLLLPSKFDGLEIEAGDLFILRTGGGGGWGPPSERDPELVRLEVERGLISIERAREDYGVVLREAPLRVDSEATEALRAQMAVAEPEWVDRGENRDLPGPGQFWKVEEVSCP